MAPAQTVTQRLFAAIRSGELSSVMLHTYDKRNCALRDAAGKTVLHAACENSIGGKQMIEQLLADGADPHVLDAHGRTPLHELAARGRPGDLQVMDTLMRTGMSPLARDINGRTPLHEFASIEWVPGCEALLQSFHTPDAMINMQDSRGITPLMEAAPSRQLTMILLSYRADPRIVDHANHSAMDRTQDKVVLSTMKSVAARLDQADRLRQVQSARSQDELLDCVNIARSFLRAAAQARPSSPSP